MMTRRRSSQRTSLWRLCRLGGACLLVLQFGDHVLDGQHGVDGNPWCSDIVLPLLLRLLLLQLPLLLLVVLLCLFFLPLSLSL